MELLMSIFYKIVEMSFVVSAVGVVTLLAKKILKTKISPKWLKILWIVFLITSINPIRLQSEFSIYNFLNYGAISLNERKIIIKEALDEHTKNSYLDIENESIVNKENTEYLETNSKQRNYFEIIKTNVLNKLPLILKISTALYFSIVLLKILLRLIAIAKIKSHTKKKFENKRLERILQNAKKTLRINNDVKLAKQYFTNSPAIYGILKPKILLNESVMNMSDSEIELIILHELLHFKNKDIFLNAMLEILKIVYWFNPLILICIRKIKKDIELSTDEMVIESLEKNRINEYCKTLLKVSLISNENFSMTLGVASNTSELEERIRMIKNKKDFCKSKMIIISTMLIVVLGITVCFATSKVNLKEENKTLTDKITNEIESNIFLISDNNTKTGLKNLIYPIEGDFVISASYGKRIHPITREENVHTGIDITRKNISGDKVLAVANGIVEYANYDKTNGNTVEIKHTDTKTGEIIYTYYAHLSSIEVEVGEAVKQGKEIGKVGATGYATGPHLHFEIRNEEKEHVDPNEYLKF